MKKAISFLIVFLLTLTFGFSQNLQKEKNVKILIHTDYGDITAILYNKTPLHRDNFVKLVNSGYYNGSIFHRVINNFMIQGGHGADGSVDPGYTIPAEFVSEYYHKKGALAAARQGDKVNPEKKSSGSQFYIVQGKKWNDKFLNKIEIKNNIKYTEEQKQTYKTIGGTPFLDGNYTVFGEVVKGFDVVDKIAVVQTNKANKPINDVKMTIKIIK